MKAIRYGANMRIDESLLHLEQISADLSCIGDRFSIQKQISFVMFVRFAVSNLFFYLL
jgi:hypothetical protein